jgi:hypothetical protein
MLEAEEATGAVGLAETALATKALSAPRAKAATPAMTRTRKVPKARGRGVFTTVDIFL